MSVPSLWGRRKEGGSEKRLGKLLCPDADDFATIIAIAKIFLGDNSQQKPLTLNTMTLIKNSKGFPKA